MAESDIGQTSMPSRSYVNELSAPAHADRLFKAIDREIRFPTDQTTHAERARVELSNDAWSPTLEVKSGESIQKAIDKAPDGAVIHVQPGIYRERLNISRDNITLKGDGKAVIDLADKNVSGAAIQISDRKNVTVDGFEIRNVRGGETPTGIHIDGASKNISLLNNNIHHVESSSNARPESRNKMFLHTIRSGRLVT